ncbi:hypothetical protein GCM10010123_06180 [Pilimelia anulata]|uniref:Uncharacterized protein n=1 Tax=Pilimelia anulata TaxID=53371 RepID=A0A8J3B7K4_9ACTN|nr:hypothetical protein GCM10010123_06180 [Pilimelia anulata]
MFTAAGTSTAAAPRSMNAAPRPADTAAGVWLVCRRYVDYGRVRSAICPAS